MTRIFNLVLFGLLFAAASGVYSIKYEAAIQAGKVAKLRRDIEAEQRSIEMLKAEWAYISQPGRLNELSRRHLDLVPMRITQIINARELPDRGREQDLIAQKLEGLGLGAASAEPQVTGSTR